MNMRTLRSTPVKELTSEQCRKLLVHHHGGALDPLRRKAYLLKAHPGQESAYFKPDEQRVIERAIEEGV